MIQMSKYYVKKLSCPRRQNTIWELSIFALWVREPPQFFIFPLLWTFTCSRTRCATNRVRGVAGILFRMASRQTVIIATSCSIWPHEILAFSTSAFPSFYSSHILAHFQVFTMQRHAVDCFVRRHGYVSNTSGQLFPLPVILSCWRWGRVRCFCLGIYEGSCINPIWNVGGPRLFWPKISKIPRPTAPIKSVPS